MSNHTLHKDSSTTSSGLVYLDCSFVTAGAGNPVITYLSVGAGALAGTTCRGNGIASVTHPGVGIYLVTLNDNFRWVVTKACELEDLTTPGDGAYGSLGPAVNEATQLPIQFYAYTRAAAGTLTNFTGRRVYISACLKNSLAGT